MKHEIKKVIVKNEEINPRVLTAVLFSQVDKFPKGYRLQERYVYDYEFELIVYSNGSMIIDDTRYYVKKGDIIFRKPGQYTQGIMPYSSYTICVDLLNNTGKSHVGYYIYNKQNFQNYCINPILEKIPTILHPLSQERSFQIFDSILKDFITPSPVSDLSIKSNVLDLICYLYQNSTDPFINNDFPLSHHFKSLKDVIEYIENNLEKKMVLNDFSKVANLSPSHFHRIFTSTLGITPHDFILKCKLDKAKKLLAKTGLTVSEVSVQCGFENIPYFCSVFKKNTGVTPLEFRKKYTYV